MTCVATRGMQVVDDLKNKWHLGSSDQNPVYGRLRIAVIENGSGPGERLKTSGSVRRKPRGGPAAVRAIPLGWTGPFAAMPKRRLSGT